MKSTLHEDIDTIWIDRKEFEKTDADFTNPCEKYCFKTEVSSLVNRHLGHKIEMIMSKVYDMDDLKVPFQKSLLSFSP